MKNDGGCAFPFTWEVGNTEYSDKGMSLRDYFAAKAMQAFVVEKTPAGYLTAGRVASRAYEQADAMLAERDK